MKCQTYTLNPFSRIYLFISLLPLLSAFTNALIITVPSNVQVHQTAPVTWQLERNDPPQWDFRFLRHNDSWDAGLAAANINAADANGGKGSTPVSFPCLGDLILVAVAGPSNSEIGASNVVTVSTHIPTATSTPSTTSTTLTPTCSSNSSLTCNQTSISTSLAALRKISKTPVIVGGIVGGLAFLFLGAFLSICLCRRRRLAGTASKPSRHYSFYGDRMVQRRDREGQNIVAAQREGMVQVAGGGVYGSNNSLRVSRMSTRTPFPSANAAHRSADLERGPSVDAADTDPREDGGDVRQCDSGGGGGSGGGVEGGEGGGVGNGEGVICSTNAFERPKSPMGPRQPILNRKNVPRPLLLSPFPANYFPSISVPRLLRSPRSTSAIATSSAAATGGADQETSQLNDPAETPKNYASTALSSRPLAPSDSPSRIVPIARVTSKRSAIVIPPKTQRQLMIKARIVELQERIADMGHRPGMAKELGEIRRKIRALRDWSQGEWATGLGGMAERPEGWEWAMEE